ncbi:hypothetical protein WJ438_06215 [Streptomyces sp. GD-15H]|uniref:hypothetical protein n=1 Tax=Streptomyces sp. GD-15H TaxID=3129112 RepID=UPI0032546C02
MGGGPDNPRREAEPDALATRVRAWLETVGIPTAKLRAADAAPAEMPTVRVGTLTRSRG